MQIDLSSQKILVTGASRGIGKAIATQLAKSGARVGIHYNQNQEEAQKLKEILGEKTFLFQADLSDNQQVATLFEEVLQKMKGLTALVNNAGIALSSPLDMEAHQWLENWQKTLQVNLTATGLLSRLAIQYFIKQKIEGRLVHISSRAAFRGDTSDYFAYAASKAGMVSLSHSIARAYGKNGSKSFVIAPGFTRTDMAEAFIEAYGEDFALNDIALPELTQPQDIAPLATLLVSGLADHATGTSIDVNAGSYVH